MWRWSQGIMRHQWGASGRGANDLGHTTTYTHPHAVSLSAVTGRGLLNKIRRLASIVVDIGPIIRGQFWIKQPYDESLLM